MGAGVFDHYIQNVKCVGNCMMFWRIGGHGYTVNLDEAWRVTKDQAEQICKSRPEEDIPRRCDLIDSLAKRHVDIQAVLASERMGLL